MSFQQDKIDPVKIIYDLRKIKSKLNNLKDKPLDQYLSIKLLKRKIGSNNGRDFYNEIVIKNLDPEIKIIEKNIGRDFQHFFRVIEQRFYSSDIHLEAAEKFCSSVKRGYLDTKIEEEILESDWPSTLKVNNEPYLNNRY